MMRIVYEIRTCRAAVVGSGAAGYGAAWRLYENGVRDVLLLTEERTIGTSRNAGSDKQTYYKLSLSGDAPDSVRAMADDLMAGGAMDGELAYAEAAGSAAAFLDLARLGVPFPQNRYGEYVGYRTDHDTRARATSAGPLTSKIMTEVLERAVEERHIPILDGYRVISLLTSEEGACIGLMALAGATEEEARVLLLNTPYVILATGGPAGIYRDTVYPVGHTGGSGIAFEAGVWGKNLTEWQYGLASTAPRWNVSGTYMQVLPRFVSVDREGREHAFLEAYFSTPGELLSTVFRKGYEWPFDVRRVPNGSSLIDLLVWRETALYGRRVYLDYRRNPFDADALDFSLLDPEAHSYLKSAEACFGTPLARLCHMNRPAYELYLSKGVDLAHERLEIALCAQHNNGGLAVDLWWQTNLPGLFAVGECAGTHGVYRPGGSALNAGQVGAARAARYIAAHPDRAPLAEETFREASAACVAKHTNLMQSLLSDRDNVDEVLSHTRALMSEIAGAVRRAEAFEGLLCELSDLLGGLSERVKIASPTRLSAWYGLRDTLLSQFVYLSAMRDYVAAGGDSRGSAVYAAKPLSQDLAAFGSASPEMGRKIIETLLDTTVCRSRLRDPNPLPEGGGFFENVWRDYRTHGNVY